MPDISKIKLKGITYDIKDTEARNVIGNIDTITQARVDEITDYTPASFPSPVYAYDTVADMQADDSLQEGMIAHTNGFHTTSDGGAAYYTISASGIANDMDVLGLENGLFATLVVTESYATPEQFGAWGDGTKDDTAAIQRCFDSYANVLLNNMYAISGYISYSSNAFLHGNGELILLEGLTQTTKSMLKPNSGTSNVKISGLTFDHRGDVYGNNGNSPCISVNKCSNVTIESCTFRNIQTMAVWFDDNTDSTKQIFIVNNVIENSYAGGFSVFGSGDGIIISDNIIYNTKDDAIALQHKTGGDTEHRCTNVVISGNVIESCYEQGESGSTPRGILCLDAKDVVISGNSIDKTYGSNIYVNIDSTTDTEPMNIVISDNVCCNSGYNNLAGSGTPKQAIQLRGRPSNYMSGIKVIGNSIRLGNAEGISVIYATDVDVLNNTIINTKQEGIFVQHSNNGIIGSNTIKDCGTVDSSKTGIYFANVSEHFNVHDNKISGNYINYAITIQNNCSGLYIHDNNCYGCAGGYRDLAGSNNIYGRNIGKDGYPFVKQVTLSANDTDIVVSGISRYKNRTVIVAQNAEASALLALGYYIKSGSTDSIEFTVSSAVGGEIFDVIVL